MAVDTNLIPSIYAAGSFEAVNPFDKVVNVATFYTVEAIRTIPEMQAMKMNLYELVFKPIGVLETDYQTILERAVQQNVVIVSLTSRGNPPVYVVSSYFKSFPLVDGVRYERMALIVDMGPCPPSMAATLALAQSEIKDYVANAVGVTAEIRLATIPTQGYVSKAQADIFENTRRGKITNTNNNVARIKELETAITGYQTYIAELEAALKKP